MLIFSFCRASCSAFGLAAGGESFMDTLPDPMRLDLVQVVFVMLLIAVLFFFLKGQFFKPLVRVMDEREANIQAGATSRLEATQALERNQAIFDERMRGMREEAFAYRKQLTDAAQGEKHRLIARTRQEAGQARDAALTTLKAQVATAEGQLKQQVDELSQTLAQHLLQKA